MIIVLVAKYKTEDNPYVNGFVHTRVKSYLEHGVESKVFVLNNSDTPGGYSIDGVDVISGNEKEFKKVIESFEDVSLCIHFLDSKMIKAISKLNKKVKTVVFVHGVEALKWYQRLFKGAFSSFRQAMSFVKYIFVNNREMKTIRDFLKGDTSNYTFVTVSKWMKNAAEKTWNCRGKLNWEIIPNIVDTTRFKYFEKGEEDRFKLLSIRPFSSGKYANDITTDLILNLKKEFNEDKISMIWVGEGRLYEKTVAPVKSIKNITLVNRMLNQSEIPSFHQKAGLFICPTRQDAQGVSMCEAMSGGLVPITLWNTAIPEYLPDEPILRCNNVKDMENLVRYLMENKDEFLRLSRKCSDFVKEKCSAENTTERELAIIKCGERKVNL